VADSVPAGRSLHRSLSFFKRDRPHEVSGAVLQCPQVWWNRSGQRVATTQGLHSSRRDFDLDPDERPDSPSDRVHPFEGRRRVLPPDASGWNAGGRITLGDAVRTRGGSRGTSFARTRTSRPSESIGEAEPARKDVPSPACFWHGWCRPRPVAPQHSCPLSRRETSPMVWTRWPIRNGGAVPHPIPLTRVSSLRVNRIALHPVFGRLPWWRKDPVEAVGFPPEIFGRATSGESLDGSAHSFESSNRCQMTVSTAPTRGRSCAVSMAAQPGSQPRGQRLLPRCDVPRTPRIRARQPALSSCTIGLGSGCVEWG